MGMNLEHDFTVPASVEETWAALLDIEGVAGCFPGAAITDVAEQSFEGTVKVKLGPIALTYKGSGSFTEIDDAAHRLRLEAKGRDRRGNGTASADVVATLSGVDTGTRVVVTTDLTVTGKPAQFGRGVMQDVSDRLLAQFTECLSQRLGGPSGAVVDVGPDTEAATDQPAPTPTPTPGPAATAPSPPPPRADDAIDLGTTVLPVLVRTYWPHVLAAVAGVLILRWWWRRGKPRRS